jgi:parallel beta-helix repeat protein
LKRKAAVGIMLALLLISTLTLAFDIQPVKSDWTWTETIYIRADGSYEPDTAPISTVDNITYTLTDNIVGDIPEGSSAIVVERDNIVVDGAGYTFQGGGTGINLTDRSNITIKNTEIKEFYRGIFLYSSSNISISGNNITNNYYCISLHSSSNHNNIFGNYIANNEYGIYLRRSSNNTICLNNITANMVFGIYLLEDCDYTTICGNNIANNHYGIHLTSSSYNIIYGNVITDRNHHGIDLFVSSNNNSIFGNNIKNNTYGVHIHSSSDNNIYHNNFIDNTYQAHTVTSGYANSWDNGYPSGGNYWSDHNPPDIYGGPYQNETGRDKIGDIPYVIDGNNTDRYPLIYPYGYVPSPDFNGDGTVNILDAIRLASVFGSKPGDPYWNPIIDINQDGSVNILDAIILAGHFGETV